MSGEKEPVSDQRPRRGRRGSGAGRPPGRFYSLKAEHLELLAELDRLFPARAPFVDLAHVPAGAESVEVVARTLYSALHEHFEQPVFVAFCHVNAERMLDAIDAILERGAYPLSRESVLADLYMRVWERVRSARRGARTGAGVEPRWREPDDTWSVHDMLVAGAESLVREQIEFLAACELPLPGLQLPELDPGDGALERTQALLQSRGSRISGNDARHWIVHALLRMPEAERRLLHLREKRGFTYREIAVELGLSPFEAGMRVRRAVLALEDRILKTAAAFQNELPGAAAEATRGDDSGSMGRLLTLRKRGEPPPTSSESEREHED